MYVPASFAEHDQEKLHDLMVSYSFATLVSGGGTPVATHLPILLDRSVGPHGQLVGHMARANSHWQDCRDREVLVIFNGPHAYVSPSWYEESQVVPTWNYVAVHAYGGFRLEEDPDQLAAIVRRYVEVYESDQETPWSLDGEDGDFVKGLLASIVGFRIQIERLEGKWKLNQNQSAERRDRVRKALGASSGEHQRQLAQWMAERK